MYEVIGIKRVDYVSKKTGKEVKGFELQTIYVDKRIEGMAVEKLYIKGDELNGIIIGSKVNAYYDRFGNIANLELIS